MQSAEVLKSKIISIMHFYPKLIPTIDEIFSVILVFFLFTTFYFNGRLISKNNLIPTNLALGWSFFSFLVLSLNIFFHMEVKHIFYFYLFLSSIVFLFQIKSVLLIELYKLRKYIFLVPLILILVNTKTFGFDSFAFILKRTIYLIEYSHFPKEIFRSNYPFTSDLIYYFANIHTTKFIENTPAITDFILLSSMSLIIYNFLSKKNYKNQCYLISSFIIIFFNPMIMNVYSYSSYADLHVSFVVLVTYFFLYKKDFNLDAFNRFDYLNLGLLLSLLSITKISSIVISFSILFSFVIVSLINKKSLKKIAILIFFTGIIATLQFALWHYHIYEKNIYVGNSYVGFRYEIFSSIFSGYINQFFVKKLLILSNFVFILLPILIFITKNKISNKLSFSILIGIPTLMWNLFLMIFFIFIQGEGHAKEFHNFFRYISQFSGIFTFALIFFSIEYLKKIKIHNIKFINYYLVIIFIFLTFFNFDKIRRDLNPNDLKLRNEIIKANLNEEILESFILRENKGSYNNIFLNFYINVVNKRNF